MNRHVALPGVARATSFSALLGRSPAAVSPSKQLFLAARRAPFALQSSSTVRLSRQIACASSSSYDAASAIRLSPRSAATSQCQATLSWTNTYARQLRGPVQRHRNWTGQIKSAWTSQKRSYSDGLRTRSNASTPGSKATRADDAAKHAAGQTVSSGAGKTILERLPQIHRPTKEELLAAASGFWHRLGIRFKWFSIRSARPFNLDEIGAFISWIFWGHVLWVVIGTTTFVSLLVLALNTVFAQETLAGWVGNYLTRSSGVKVVFESAIVPKWKNGVITFQNVFVSRRPGEQTKSGRSVSKGSSTTAAAAAEAAALDRAREAAGDGDDGNYTQYDVTIESVNVTLSFAKWLNGKGLLRDVEINGVRGVIDRTSVRHSDEYVDPKSYRHEHNPGDFEIDNFKMEDVLLTVYQPNDFRPFTVSVFNCELPRLRKQWLFYDFMSANNMSGSFDNSLFTVHPRQVHGHAGLGANGGAAEEDGRWKKHSRLRIDGLNIDHLNRGVEGPFSWIHEGNVDIVADVMIPTDGDGLWTKVMSGIHESIDRMEASVTNSQVYAQVQRGVNGSRPREDTTIHHSPSSGPQTSPNDTTDSDTHKPDARHDEATGGSDNNDNNQRLLVLDMRIQLNDVRATVPLFTKELSYVNNALVRPIVAYLNARRGVTIPVACRVVKRQAEFDGSWTVFDSGLLDDVSRATYDAFATDVVDARARKRRFRKVGLWTLQVAVQALFIGLAGQLA